MSNAVIFMEVAGKHCVVHWDTSDLLVLYRGGADSGVQLGPEVVKVITHPGGGGNWIQQTGGGWVMLRVRSFRDRTCI